MSNHNPETPSETQQALSSRALLLQEIGNKLNQARQTKQEQISKAVRHLKIPVNHLQALESGNWDSLPDDVYVIGFLRQYSNYLNIDLSNEIKRLKNSDYTLTRPLTFPDPPVAPSRRWAWLTGSAFVLLFVAFNIISNDDSTPTATYKPEQSSVTQLTGMPGTTPPSHPKKKAENSLEQQAQQLPSTTIVAHKPIATPPKNSTLKAPVASRPSQQPSKLRMHSFRFEAVTAPVWMQIFAPNKAGDGKGRLLKEMLLKKGHHATIQRATESLWITCGNALSLRIKVDRETIVPTGKLGSGKKVLRDYHFNINNY